MLLYIHGFGSCGNGEKSATLRAHFGDDEVLAPDLPPDPLAAIALLEDLIASQRVDLLVGSSLGGYYADWLNGRHLIPCVLINPATQPCRTLAPFIGPNRDWCRGEIFQWKAEYLDSLRRMYRPAPGEAERYLVLLQTGDEVLDYRLAERRYRNQEVVVEPGGSHRFENLAAHLPAIERFRIAAGPL
jgi:predicted esterase YcpF (UPF0227 family)